MATSKKNIRQKANKESPAKNSDFGKIYNDGGKKKINMSKMERGKQSHKGKVVAIVAVLLVFLAGAALAGFFLFNRGQTATGDSLTVSVEAPKKIASGDDISLEISYLNEDKVTLNNAEISIIYPEGFFWQEASPSPNNEGKSVWDLGNLSPGVGGKLDLTGQLIGNVGDTKTFMIVADYTPENFSSTFQEKEAHSVEITSSILELEPAIPTRVVADQEVEFKYKLINNSENDLLKIRLDFEFPNEFSQVSSEPVFKDASSRIELDRLDAKNSREITIVGSLAGEEGDSRELKVLYGLVQEGGVFRRQGEQSSIIYIVKPELNLQLEVDGGIQGTVVDVGDQLDFTVKYENASEVLIEKLELVASFSEDLDILDFGTFQDENNGEYDQEEDTITWNMINIPEFASIKPGNKGEFGFTINTKESFSPQSEDDKHLILNSKVSTSTMTIAELGEDFEQNSESNQVEVKINSKVNLEAQGWYYSKDLEEVGSGPLPPQVGQTTSYRITWDVSSLYNDLEEVEVSAKLPKNVFFVGKTYTSDSGDIKFDSDSRLVTWKIHRIPANTGYLFATYQAYFDVSITPTAKDKGKRMILLEKPTLIGRDTYTNEDVASEDTQVTTNLENDNAAEGKGIVAPAKNTNTNTDNNNNSNTNSNTNTDSGCPTCGDN